jgi:FAD/FMN-containing dehydrogenase
MSIGPDRTAYARRCAALLASLPALDTGPWGLTKTTSNLFRDRHEKRKQRLDLRDFSHVLEVNVAQGWVDVEGGASYEVLVDATLREGAMPEVVPQLKTITVAGAVCGVGIEATSFRAGLVHHSMIQADVLLPTGEIALCKPDNEHSDLFHGLANSYGTLGYALRLRMRVRAVKPYVRVRHIAHEHAGRYFADLESSCEDSSVDFVDGVVFAANKLVVTRAAFVESAPWLSDYRYERIYYRSLLDDEVDYLSVRDYLWRWDTDWFWCSRNFGLDRLWLRRLVGRSRLNSRTYTRLMRWNARLGITRLWTRLRGRHSESVIQDVDIPIAAAAGFLDFLLREIGILPIWTCPVREPSVAADFPLYPLRKGTLYVNFGFWDVVVTRRKHEPGHFNRLIEREVLRVGGLKSLYSESFFERAEFASAYGAAAYERLRRRYDPTHRLLDLYAKCVGGH